MFCVFRSLLIFSFSFICFSCRFCLIFLDLLRNMLPFYRVFFTSLFPPFVHHLSICSFFFCLLLFSRFFHLFSLFKLPFFFVFSVSLCFYMSNSLWKKFLNFCETIFLLFTTKNFVFSVSFSLGLFFPCLVFFSVLKNGFSFL